MEDVTGMRMVSAHRTTLWPSLADVCNVTVSNAVTHKHDRNVFRKLNFSTRGLHYGPYCEVIIIRYNFFRYLAPYSTVSTICVAS
jgi:hypothetical protein